MQNPKFWILKDRKFRGAPPTSFSPSRISPLPGFKLLTAQLMALIDGSIYTKYSRSVEQQNYSYYELKEMRTATPRAKNNNKYNNCTMECIKLSICTQLSLKLEFEKIYFRVSVLKIRNNIFRTILASWETFICFCLQSLWRRKQNPNDLHKEIKS